MAKAGFSCLIRRGGVSTAVSNEATTAIGGGRYQITSSARRAIDPATPWHLKVTGATIAYSLITAADFAFGEFTVPTAGANPTFSGAYLPITTRSEDFYEVKGHTLIEADELLDTTVYTSTSRFRKRILGLADASLSLDMLLNAEDMDRLATLRFNNHLTLVEINSGFSSVFRGYGRIESVERTAAVDGLIEAKVEWKLSGERDEATNLIFGYSDRLIASS